MPLPDPDPDFERRRQRLLNRAQQALRARSRQRAQPGQVLGAVALERVSGPLRLPPSCLGSGEGPRLFRIVERFRGVADQVGVWVMIETAEL